MACHKNNCLLPLFRWVDWGRRFSTIGLDGTATRRSGASSDARSYGNWRAPNDDQITSLQRNREILFGGKSIKSLVIAAVSCTRTARATALLSNVLTLVLEREGDDW